MPFTNQTTSSQSKTVEVIYRFHSRMNERGLYTIDKLSRCAFSSSVFKPGLVKKGKLLHISGQSFSKSVKKKSKREYEKRLWNVFECILTLLVTIKQDNEV